MNLNDLKEKYANYQQRQEAKKYFRQYNTSYLDAPTKGKLVLTGIGITLGLGILVALIKQIALMGVSLDIGWLMGYPMVRALRKVHNGNTTFQVILSLVCYVGVIFVGCSFTYFLFGLSRSYSVLTSLQMMLRFGLVAIFHQGPISLLFDLVGAYETYLLASN